jgi:Tfp pilus assembly protein PilO
MNIDRPIIIAILLFATLLIVFFLVAPGYGQFVKLQIDLAEKKAEFNSQYEYYAVITKNYFDLDSKKEEIQKIDDALPVNQDLGRLVYYFQKTVMENGMSMKNLYLSKNSLASASTKQQKSVKDSKINDTVFSLTLEGDYSSLERFISSLEKSSRMFEVLNISFGSPTNDIFNSLASMASSKQGQEPQIQAQKMYTFSMQVLCHSY